MVKEGRPIPVRFPVDDERRIRVFAIERGLSFSAAVRALVNNGLRIVSGDPPIVHRMAARKNPPEPRVYFIRCAVPGESLIKIGFTTKMQMRISAMATGNPFPLTLLFSTPGGAAEEKTFHDRFEKHRINANREWFREEGELAEYIARELKKERRP